MKVINWIALILVVIGALNWGMVGFFQIDVISSIFGSQSAVGSRIIYALVGLAGLWSISFFRWLPCCCKSHEGVCRPCGSHLSEKERTNGDRPIH